MEAARLIAENKALKEENNRLTNQMLGVIHKIINPPMVMVNISDKESDAAIEKAVDIIHELSLKVMPKDEILSDILGFECYKKAGPQSPAGGG